jgi:thiosulfate dehydrogenase
MIKQGFRKVAGPVALLIAVAALYARAQQEPKHQSAQSDGKTLVVQLCDGKTNVAVKGVAPGQRLSLEQARSVSDQLMSKWMGSQPPDVAAAWSREAREATATNTAQAKDAKPAAPTNLDEQTVDFSPRDHFIWDREVTREIEYGNQLFHDDKLIGSTVGIACAMCHPNASNTHPETYPKFQIQLKRVALLRDMINWCIENPIQGKTLAADDPKMRALEAYILAQRKGVPLEPGKH